MWQTLVPVAVAFAVGVCIGGDLASRVSQSEIDELKEQHFHLIEEINRKSNEAYSELSDKLRDREKALAAALDSRDRALAVADNLRADAVRLREQATRASQRLRAMPRADGPACVSDRERLARCVGLLGEGAGLAGEGAAISIGVAADKDVVGVK